MNRSVEIPKDIIAKLRYDFKGDDYKKAVSIIKRVNKDHLEEKLNVGWVQLSRAMVILAKGDLKVMIEIFESRYNEDPRDILTQLDDHHFFGMNPVDLKG